MKRVKWMVMLAMLLLLCGCQKPQQAPEQKAQAYLKEKYGQSFSYLYEEEGKYIFDAPGRKIAVKVETDACRDDYQIFQYEKAAQQYVQEMAQETIGASSVVYVSVDENFLGAEEIFDLKHYLQKCEKISVEIHTTDSFLYKEKALKRFCEDLKQSGIFCTVSIYYLEDAYMALLSAGNQLDTQSEYIEAMGTAQMDRDGTLRLSWSK